MRPFHTYDPSCPDCIPAILNTKTRESYPRDHPLMVAVMKVWDVAPFAERKAYMAVTRENSTDPRVLATAKPLLRRMEQAMNHISSN